MIKVLFISCVFCCHFALADEPLHLVISEMGNRAKIYQTEGGEKFTLMAEIQGKLNFSLRGSFDEANVIAASVIAPGGKKYTLEVFGEQPPTTKGMMLRFLAISNGNGYSDFSIGSWKVNIKFNVDGEKYEHSTSYLITWRKPDEGIWGMQLWSNRAKEKIKKDDKPLEK